ncbi:hypothetical protein NB647_06125 [Oxalobacter aliiformigenes]|uniref:Uncharacterized protein n=1 Tax=Oxalobacter aliiformigenes TaxID=2946593 RepID=A0A9E9NSR3_9BURK|nr:hypothetical protein [Oxalobacter aliiformigenes]WAV88480.1 hypothetical protein NB647_06125 [Oxalobacter aliiformigenes]WAV90509.1 hypothetical protein NB646_06440 [Oxalobacter aliiformigenes]
MSIHVQSDPGRRFFHETMDIPFENVSFLGQAFAADPADGRFVREYDPNIVPDGSGREYVDPFAWNHFGKSETRYHLRNTPLFLMLNHEYYEHSHT